MCREVGLLEELEILEPVEYLYNEKSQLQAIMALTQLGREKLVEERDQVLEEAMRKVLVRPIQRLVLMHRLSLLQDTLVHEEIVDGVP